MWAAALMRAGAREAGVAQSRLRAGLIGCGFFARNHLHAWRDLRSEGVELVAVCDRERHRAEEAAQRFAVAQVYDDAGAMLREARLDFVDIVTTMPSHRPLVELAARHQVPAIVQKPFAPTLGDCEAMVRACRTAGVPLMVHENFRFQTPIMAVAEALAEGTIGLPFFARISWRTGYDVYAGQPYLADEERLIILDVGIHLLDVARHLFGEAGEVTCRTSSVRRGIRGEDAAALLLAHDNGVAAVVDATYNAPLDPDPFPETVIEIDGRDGTIRLRPGYELTITGRSGSERREVAPALLPWASRPWHGIQESVLNIQRHWVRCLRAGVEPATSGADNLRTFALAEAAYASAARRATVYPPL
jgi:D-apiose dehydrogenase